VSHWISDQSVAGADLIITAEREHVVAIAGRWGPAFAYTFTLPELIARGEQAGPRDGRTLQQWLTAVSAKRPSTLEYLDADVGEI
jgi:hypothetical protein